MRPDIAAAAAADEEECTIRNGRILIMGKLAQFVLDSSQNWSEIKQLLCGERGAKRDRL